MGKFKLSRCQPVFTCYRYLYFVDALLKHYSPLVKCCLPYFVPSFSCYGNRFWWCKIVTFWCFSVQFYLKYGLKNFFLNVFNRKPDQIFVNGNSEQNNLKKNKWNALWEAVSLWRLNSKSHRWFCESFDRESLAFENPIGYEASWKPMF